MFDILVFSVLVAISRALQALFSARNFHNVQATTFYYSIFSTARSRLFELIDSALVPPFGKFINPLFALEVISWKNNFPKVIRRA